MRDLLLILDVGVLAAFVVLLFIHMTRRAGV